MWQSDRYGDEEEGAGTAHRQYRRRAFVAKQKQQKRGELSNDSGRALNSMIRLLTRREYTVSELTTKLAQRYTETAIAEALKKCQEMGYQSDERYASMLVRHIENCLYGPIKLRFEAQKKGVSEDFISEYAAEVDWKKLAFLALQKKYGHKKLTWEEQRKALAYLSRRGFSTDCCLFAVKRLGSLDADEESDFADFF